MKRILDACCGSKMFWFDKNNPDVEFCDIRRLPKTAPWLDEEYQEPEVDWSKVDVDTPILVSMDGNRWHHRHFAKYCGGIVCAFEDGATSWTSNKKTGWEYAKLAEPHKTEHDGCVGCKFEHFEIDQDPCKNCKQLYTDKYELQE